MKNVTNNILMCILIYILISSSNMLFSNEINILKENIIKMRINYYENKYIPTSLELLNIYENDIKSIDDFENRLNLTALWGIVYTELTLYYYESIKKEELESLKRLYKEHRHEVKDSIVSDTLRQSGEFALLMLKLNPDNYIPYMLDTRSLFLKSLSLDKNNMKAKFGMGKWWAYLVVDRNHREMNNSASQVIKYLGDNAIEEFKIKHIDNWDSIDLFNVYYIRSIFNMRALNTEFGFIDFNKAKSIYPNSAIAKELSNLYARNIAKWF